MIRDKTTKVGRSLCGRDTFRREGGKLGFDMCQHMNGQSYSVHSQFIGPTYDMHST